MFEIARWFLNEQRPVTCVIPGDTREERERYEDAKYAEEVDGDFQALLGTGGQHHGGSMLGLSRRVTEL